MMNRFSLRKKRNQSTACLSSIENGSGSEALLGPVAKKAAFNDSPFRSPMSGGFDFLSLSRRKRRKISISGKDEDTLSLCSLNVDDREPSSKRAKAIRKSVVSLANLISPGKPNQKSSSKLQRSSSFKESGSAVSSSTAAVASFKPYRPPSNTPNKSKNNRRSKLWCETFDHTGLNEREIKWQEAIFELYQGERDLVQDLTMAKQTYRDSMVTLKMLSDEEVTLIFGKLGCLLPLHEELLNKLEQARGEDGRTLSIGYIFVEWFPRISTAYRDYCANQSDAKYALDAAVERDARVRDFLQRCLESPFSRKLDLWSYLDLPRTRLVKYPLLLQNVLKRTPADMQEERTNLDKVMEIIGEIIERVDETTGEQQCRYIRSKLEYLDDKHKSSFVDNSRLMLCSGQLKNNRGTKMHVFLFEEAFVLTRQTTRSNKISYQVYRPPLPLRSLVVDANEGEKLSGSFRGGILSSEKVKHSFRVKSEELNVSYTLQASEEHDRKQWINAIQDALAKYKAKHPDATELLAKQISRRRATYDPSSNGGKKQAARAVLRSSSDKSNRSVASSTDKSSLQEESQEEDISTASDEVGPWARTRSQTVNPSMILASKSGSSISRKSSGSSTKSDKSTKQKESKKELDAQKLRDRLKGLELDKDGPPSPLRTSFKKKSGISRHFSLSSADKSSKPVVRTRSNDEAGKERNKCQRSRSLTSSPQMTKSTRSRFGSKKQSQDKLHTSSLVVPNAAKPPIGPTSSPYSVRRSPSFNNQTIHEAQSTPNLTTVARSTSFSTRRSSTRLSQLAAQNSCSSVGNLRKGLTGNSASELRSSSIERRAEEAKILRRVRSHDKASSEGDHLESIVPNAPQPGSVTANKEEITAITPVFESIPPKEDNFAVPKPVFNLLPKSDIAIVCTPATPKDTPRGKNMQNERVEDESPSIEDDEDVLTITAPVLNDQTEQNDKIEPEVEVLPSEQIGVISTENDNAMDQSAQNEGHKDEDDVDSASTENCPDAYEALKPETTVLADDNDIVSSSEINEHSDDVTTTSDDVTDVQLADQPTADFQEYVESTPAMQNDDSKIRSEGNEQLNEVNENEEENVCESVTQDEEVEVETYTEDENKIECNPEKESNPSEGIEEEMQIDTETQVSQDVVDVTEFTQDEDVEMEEEVKSTSTVEEAEECSSTENNTPEDVEMQEEIQEESPSEQETLSQEESHESTQVEDFTEKECSPVAEEKSAVIESVSQPESTQVEDDSEAQLVDLFQQESSPAEIISLAEPTKIEEVLQEPTQVEDGVQAESTQAEGIVEQDYTPAEDIIEQDSTPVGLLQEELIPVDEVHEKSTPVEDTSDILEEPNTECENVSQLESTQEETKTEESNKQEQIVLEKEEAVQVSPEISQSESCDSENNNIEHSNIDVLVDNKTDGCLNNNDIEVETANCCRTEISDENRNQMQNLQTSV